MQNGFGKLHFLLVASGKTGKRGLGTLHQADPLQPEGGHLTCDILAQTAFTGGMKQKTSYRQCPIDRAVTGEVADMSPLRKPDLSPVKVEGDRSAIGHIVPDQKVG